MAGSSSARRARVVGACALRPSLAAACVANARQPTRDTTRVEQLPPPQYVSTTEAQLLATFHQPGAAEHWVVTLQHFSTWGYGSNFFFLDASAPPKLQFFSDAVGLYLECAPVFSLSPITRAHVGVELEPSHDYPVRAVHEGWEVAYSPMVRWVF